MHFPDNRAKFAGTAPWDVANIKDSIRAVRGESPSGSRFRLTTSENPPEPEAPVVEQPETVVPTPKDSEI